MSVKEFKDLPGFKDANVAELESIGITSVEQLKDAVNDEEKSKQIIKTLSGCAGAAGEAIDTSRMAHIKGSIAGDNTLLIIVDEKANVPLILQEFSSLMKDNIKE